MVVTKTENLCGAKTRAGTPCRRRPTPLGRCNLHGGKSLKGDAHPRYKHGRYSKHTFAGHMARAELLRKRRERERQLEDNYVQPRMDEWMARHARRKNAFGPSFVNSLLAAEKRLRQEYRERLAADRANRARRKEARRKARAQARLVEGVPVPAEPAAQQDEAGHLDQLGRKKEAHVDEVGLKKEEPPSAAVVQTDPEGGASPASLRAPARTQGSAGAGPARAQGVRT
jgi:hypothetical protein